MELLSSNSFKTPTLIGHASVATHGGIGAVECQIPKLMIRIDATAHYFEEKRFCGFMRCCEQMACFMDDWVETHGSKPCDSWELAGAVRYT